MSFFTDYLADAQNASSQCGVLVSVILAQWADETSYGGSDVFVNGNNYAGVSVGGGVNTFPTKAAGLDAYIQTLNLSYYDPVRQASGWQAQCVALGASPWAASKYDANDYYAGLPLNPGVDLLSIVQGNNLTQFDVGATSPSGTAPSNSASTAQAGFLGSPQGAQIPTPALGFASNVSTGQIIINGSTAAELVGDALVAASLHLDIAQAATMTLTLHDPDRTIINSPEMAEASILNFGTMWFSLVSVQKQGNVLTATFESGIVSQLRKADGAFTVTPGTMTRGEFAALLVSQVQGAKILRAPDSYLQTLGSGYTGANQEQLSRGTISNPLEDSWTCLQRLANEIQWVCFETFGVVYFGPYSWLASLPPVMWAQEFQNGIQTIDGTYDIGQPLGEITVTAVADSWTPTIGQSVQINDLGVFSGGANSQQRNWIVSRMERNSLTEPDITITLQQPLPGLPEPSSGGAQAAVGSGAGNVQSTGGAAQVQQALNFALSKVGLPYSEDVTLRLGPTAYDCSGLVYEAYLSAGVTLAGTTTNGMWPDGAGAHVPDGVGNLQPGDLLFFGDAVGQTHTNHVAMVHTVDVGGNTASCVQATDPSHGVQDSVTYSPIAVGTSFGQGLIYLGATRPAP